MSDTLLAEPHRTPNSSTIRELVNPLEAVIRSLEQQASDLDDGYYEARREARDALRRAAELRLQALETRMRLCALVECEPLDTPGSSGTTALHAILRLAHIYFDEPGMYRLVLQPLGAQASRESNDEGVPVWCSKVVYDAARPEGTYGATISVAVRAAYRAAEQQGCRVVWDELVTA